jgi:outer membrane protein assembly factor BamB
MRRSLYLVALAVLAQVMWAGPAIAWNFPRGPVSGTGANLSETTITTGNVGSLARIWARGSSGGYAGAVTAADGRVFYGNGAGPYRSTGPSQIIARRATTGRLLWQTPLPGSTYSTPVVSDGHVFALASASTEPTARLYALSARSGRVLWWHGVAGGGGDVPMAPVVHRGVVYMDWGDSDETLTALDAVTGEVVWNRRHQILGSPLAFFGDYLISGGLVYRPSTGRLIGSLPGPEGTMRYIVTKRAVYSLAPFNDIDSPRMLVSAYPTSCIPRAVPCRAIWRRWISGTNYDHTFAVTPRRILIPIYFDQDRTAGGVVALRAGRGGILWRWTAPSGMPANDLSVGGGVVYVTSWRDAFPHLPRFYALAAGGCGTNACPALNSWEMGRHGISRYCPPVIQDGIVFIWNDFQDGLWAFAPS